MLPILPLAGAISGIASLAQTFLGKPTTIPASPGTDFQNFIQERSVRFQATGFELQQMGPLAQRAIFQTHLGRKIEIQDQAGRVIQGALESVRWDPQGVVLGVGGEKFMVSQAHLLRLLN